MGLLAGKVAIVTGAGVSRPGMGNGRATAILFAREGAQLVLADRNLSSCTETKDMIAAEGGHAIAVTADVADEADCARIVAAGSEAFGGIDILHNNVGISSHGGALELDPAEWDRVFAVNVRSVFTMARAAIPAMLNRGGGRIINVSSIAAVVAGGTPMLAYSVSKAAVLHLTRCIATEFAAQGIRCNGILPGLIDTPMVRDHAESRRLRHAGHGRDQPRARLALAHGRPGLALGHRADRAVLGQRGRQLRQRTEHCRGWRPHLPRRRSAARQRRA